METKRYENRDELYGRRWRRERKVFLTQHPLCVFCEQQGHTTAANVVDHITPHRGNPSLFWDQGNWQSLCEHCHNTTKRRMEMDEENRELKPAIGVDGYPIDEDYYDEYMDKKCN
jgi:5-methylcytosine-specific restriction enzyme A